MKPTVQILNKPAAATPQPGRIVVEIFPQDVKITLNKEILTIPPGKVHRAWQLVHKKIRMMRAQALHTRRLTEAAQATGAPVSPGGEASQIAKPQG